MPRPSGAVGAPREWLGSGVFPSESELARAQRLRMVAFGAFVAYAIQMVATGVITPTTWSRRLTALTIVAVLVGVVHVINGAGEPTSRAGYSSWDLSQW